jgi:hypothetical protein
LYTVSTNSSLPLTINPSSLNKAASIRLLMSLPISVFGVRRAFQPHGND